MTTSIQDPLKLQDLHHWLATQTGFLRVQIMRKGETLCGVVLDGFAGTVGMFKCRTDIGEGWVQAHKVRQCSGVDGRCACAQEAASTAARSGRGTSTGRGDALGAVPLGNTGTTVGHGVAA